MPLTVSYEPTSGVVELSMSGVVFAEELPEVVRMTAAQAEEHDAHLSLSDYSQATVESSPFDVFGLHQLQLDEGLDPSIRVAVIPPLSDRGEQLADFYKVICSNRGWTAAVFRDRQEAIAWLSE